MLHDIYKGKRVFITGHTGFKGSWLTLWLQKIGAEVAGYSLKPDELSHFNLLNLKSHNYFGDINDDVSLEKAMKEFRPDIVFHLAAQALVIDSYVDPLKTYNTNVLGTLRVYQAALKANVGATVSVTTDKVYENKEWHWGYREMDALGGHDPYSSSKACVEIMTDSYRRSFLKDRKMLLASARAGNVIGGGDWAENRLIPDLIKNAELAKVTNIRNPGSVRPWQHVLEPLHGYLLLGTKLLEGKAEFADSFNFGPEANDVATVEKVCSLASQVWDKLQFSYEHVENKFHEAGILKLDVSKAKIQLGFNPTWGFQDAIQKTIEWYRNYYENGKCMSEQDLSKFLLEN